MKLRHVDGFVVLLVVFLFLGCMAAQGQIGSSISSAPMSGGEYAPPSHVAQASQHDLAPQVSLLGSNTITVAQGEQPLWEFGSDVVEPSLGSIAREYREEKFATRGHSGSGRSKQYAHIYWEQQGSIKK